MAMWPSLSRIVAIPLVGPVGQGSLAIVVSPLEHLVRIYSMLTGHSGNRSSRDKGGFHNPTLLLPCPSQPPQGRGHCPNCNRIAHKAIVGQINPSVYTAISGDKRTLTDILRADVCQFAIPKPSKDQQTSVRRSLSKVSVRANPRLTSADVWRPRRQG